MHPDALAARIAALDAEFESRNGPSPEQEAEYRAKRSELKAALADSLDNPATRG
jgi:hypothetical protein